jgi:hypothetical protein
MMKKVLIIAVLAAAALVAYNYATTGRVTLMPAGAASSEEQALRDLGQQFERAKSQFAQAHRAAAVGGVDMTSDVEAAQAAVRRIAEDLAAVKKRLTSPSSMRDADDLSRAVAEFSRQAQ